MGIVDCHCDVLSRIYRNGESLYSNRGQFDISRARTAGVILQFCALFTEQVGEMALRTILMQIGKFHQELLQCPDSTYMVASFHDIEGNRENDRVGCLLHLEGGEALGRDLELLRVLHRLGLRSIGITWNYRNLLADGALEEASGGGLSNMGRQLVKLAQELGMVVDLAHISPRGFFDALEQATAPVMVSHANARAICNHPRNLSDEQLKRLAANGGLVACTLVPYFIGPGEPGIDQFIDHIVYISNLIGVEHVGVGSDFDGVDNPVLQDVSEYIHLASALGERGFTKDETDKILQGNCLELLGKVLPRNGSL